MTTMTFEEASEIVKSRFQLTDKDELNIAAADIVRNSLIGQQKTPENDVLYANVNALLKSDSLYKANGGTLSPLTTESTGFLGTGPKVYKATKKDPKPVSAQVETPAATFEDEIEPVAAPAPVTPPPVEKPLFELAVRPTATKDLHADLAEEAAILAETLAPLTRGSVSNATIFRVSGRMFGDHRNAEASASAQEKISKMLGEATVALAGLGQTRDEVFVVADQAGNHKKTTAQQLADAQAEDQKADEAVEKTTKLAAAVDAAYDESSHHYDELRAAANAMLFKAPAPAPTVPVPQPAPVPGEGIHHD